MKLMKSAQWLLFVGLLCAAPLALAQSSGTFDQFKPDQGDAAIDYLRQIFGGIVDSVYGGTSENARKDSTIGAFMGVFGVGTYFLGMIFLTYNAVRGMVDSAEDGQFLGKKASSAWLPGRLAIGAALLAPMSSGFSLIQVIVLWLTLQGAGMGTQSFIAILDFFKETQMILQPSLPDSRPLVVATARAELCMAAMNKHYEEVGSDTRINMQTRKLKHTIGNFTSGSEKPLAGSGGAVIPPISMELQEFAWNQTGGDNNGKPICGRIQVELKRNIPNIRDREFETNIKRAQSIALFAIIPNIRKEMVALVAVGGEVNPNFIQLAINQHTKIIATAVSGSLQSSNKAGYDEFISYAKTGGFLYAGTWIGHMNRMNDAVQAAINDLPTHRSTNLDEIFDSTALQGYKDNLIKLESLKSTANDALADAYRNDVGTAGGDDAESAAKEMVSKVFVGLTGVITNSIAGDNLTHLTQMKALGDNLIGAAEVVALALGVTAGASGSKFAEYTIGIGFSIPGALQALGAIFTTAIVSLFAFGIALSVYLPFVPLIAWIMACLNWMLMVIESVIAAPLFAAAHMHPDGDERIGNAGEGYRMLLNIVMRPSLMVIALVTSIVLANAIAGMINNIFMPYMQSMTAASLTGVVKMIGFVAVYTTFMISIVHACNALIHLLPDRVMIYLGRSIAGLGGSERVESETKAGMDRFGAGAYASGRSGQSPSGAQPPPPPSGGGSGKDGGGKDAGAGKGGNTKNGDNIG